MKDKNTPELMPEEIFVENELYEKMQCIGARTYDVSEEYGLSKGCTKYTRSDLAARPVEMTEEEWFDLWRENSMNTAQEMYKGKEAIGVDAYANNMGLMLKHRYPNGVKIV